VQVSILKEFREFAVKGNVVDMSVGIIIGGAFTTIVKSMVDDVLMPPLSLLGGKATSSVSQLYLNLSGNEYSTLAEATTAGAPVLKYGLFLQNVVSFVIVAFAVFLLVKAINSLKRREEATAPPEPIIPEDVLLLREIRDSLKK
jgi:large conductance mechanosensitive channel